MSHGPWHVDTHSEPGVLRLALTGRVDEHEMAAFVAAHDAAIDGMHGADYRVFCDLRGLFPLSPQSAALFEAAKNYSARQPSFRGSAVLVSSSMIALQHQRTSVAGGVASTELIIDDEAACRAHLARIDRR